MAQPITEVRRVVMGDGARGTSPFTHVELVDPMSIGGTRVWHIWGWDHTPALPHASIGPYEPTSWRPPAGGGMRLSATRFSPQQAACTEAERASAAALEELIDAEPCGYVDDPCRAGMHRTDSIEIGVVVSGAVTVECADGASVLLQAGDVYVQNSAMHGWRPDADAHVVFISFSAEREAG